MQLQRPFSQACENNKRPILNILKSAFAPSKRVLEIGSGTGQHACYFSSNLAHLEWQPSDRSENLPGIRLWLDEASNCNLLELSELDVEQQDWPEGFDAVFSANTAHIMPWEVAKQMIIKVAQRLPLDGVFALYGPFNYEGKFTSSSNAEFDLYLKSRGQHQGIRDFEEVNAVAYSEGLSLIHDHEMPANNRMLVWKKLDPESGLRVGK